MHIFKYVQYFLSKRPKLHFSFGLRCYILLCERNSVLKFLYTTLTYTRRLEDDL